MARDEFTRMVGYEDEATALEFIRQNSPYYRKLLERYGSVNLVPVVVEFIPDKYPKSWGATYRVIKVIDGSGNRMAFVDFPHLLYAIPSKEWRPTERQPYRVFAFVEWNGGWMKEEFHLGYFAGRHSKVKHHRFVQSTRGIIQRDYGGGSCREKEKSFPQLLIERLFPSNSR